MLYLIGEMLKRLWMEPVIKLILLLVLLVVLLIGMGFTISFPSIDALWMQLPGFIFGAVCGVVACLLILTR